MAEITGKHVLAVSVGAFAVIIGVNVLLAYKAVSTFPGLEVQNSYVASQGFDRRKAAQEALGWTMTPGYEAGRMTLAFHGPDGLPVRVNELRVLVGRTTEASEDRFPEFTLEGDLYAADLPLGIGKWMVKVTALSDDGTLFEQRSELFVKG